MEIKNYQKGKKCTCQKGMLHRGFLPSTKRFKKQEISLRQEHMANPKSVSSLYDTCKTAASSTLLQWAYAKSKAMKGKKIKQRSHSSLPNDNRISRATRPWLHGAQCEPTALLQPAAPVYPAGSTPQAENIRMGVQSVTRRVHSNIWKMGPLFLVYFIFFSDKVQQDQLETFYQDCSRACYCLRKWLAADCLCRIPRHLTFLKPSF